MQIRTLLARIIEGEWTGQRFNKITLVILPREQLYVYAGEITQEQFTLLKDQAAFITLEYEHGAQLERITGVIPPLPTAFYKYAI